jgi:hypothetical protein
MNCDWEVAYLDDQKLVLRHLRGKRLSPMIVFDYAEMDGWLDGDVICVDGTLHPARQTQKSMGMPLGEDDYILTNQRTGTKAHVRKNDFDVENAWKWLDELKQQGKVK